jgi:hypothetical protein
VKNEDGETVEVPVDYQVVKVETSGGLIRQKTVKYTIQNPVDMVTETITADALQARIGDVPEMTGGTYRTVGQGEKVKEMLGDLKTAMDEARKACGKDEKMADRFSEVARAQGADAVRALTDVMKQSSQDRKILDAFAEVAKAQGAEAVRQLAHNTGFAFVKGQFVSDRFDLDENFKIYADVAKAHGADAVRELHSMSATLGEKNFAAIAEVAKLHGADAVRAFRDAYEIFSVGAGKEDNRRFDRYDFIELMIGNRSEVSDEVFDSFMGVAKKRGNKAVRALTDVISKMDYGYESMEDFRKFTEVANAQGPDAVRALEMASHWPQCDKKLFNRFAKVAKEKGSEAVRALAEELRKKR